MAQSLFRSGAGLADDNKYYLSGIGIPGSDASFQDEAGVGSQYQDTSNGNMYYKVSAGAGTTNWKKSATSEDLAAVTGGISWREPVKILDTTAVDTTAALADLDADDAIQGVTVVAGDRMLFAGISVSPNVYIVGGSSGSWTLTESTNEETAGDTVQVLEGDNSNKMYQFDGTSWGWIGQTSSDEDNHLRAFIGKGAAGSEFPAYTSIVHVSNGDNLETAIGKLDAALNANDLLVTANSNSITTNTTNITKIEATLGGLVDANGDYVAHSGTNYIDSNASLTEDLTDLDTQIKTNEDNVTTNTTEISNSQTAVGLSATGTFVPFSGTNYLDSATSLVNADSLLDTELLNVNTLIGDTSDYTSNNFILDGDSVSVALAKLDAGLSSSVTPTSGTNITTQTVVDSVLVDDVEATKWLISAYDASGNKESFEVFSTHNGTASTDATDTDFNIYGKLKFGSPISGYDIDIGLSGSGVGQTMTLLVTSTAAVEIQAVRLTV